jgi:TfoX/Sxy family transcriptional regulator of competence genes
MSNDYTEICNEHLADPSVKTSRMFGTDCLKVGGKVFAMEFKGQLVVKLNKDRASALVAGGQANVFDPGHGRPMKQWIAVAASSTLDWQPLAVEAKDCVSHAPDSKPRKSK